MKVNRLTVNTNIVQQICKHVSDEDFDIMDYPGIELPKISPQEQIENVAAVRRFGKKFAILLLNVMPDCGKVSFPLSNSEKIVVSKQIREHGWKVLDEWLVMSEPVKAFLSAYNNRKLSPKELYEVLVEAEQIAVTTPSRG